MVVGEPSIGKLNNNYRFLLPEDIFYCFTNLRFDENLAYDISVPSLVVIGPSIGKLL